MNAALLSSKNMCWCTPQDFFDKLNAEFYYFAIVFKQRLEIKIRELNLF